MNKKLDIIQHCRDDRFRLVPFAAVRRRHQKVLFTEPQSAEGVKYFLFCRFLFVVSGFWSGVFPPAGEDRLLPYWFFIVFVLFPIDFVVFFSFCFVVFSLFLLGMLR